MKNFLKSIAGVVALIAVTLSVCSCGTVTCGWCNEECSKLSSHKAAVLGQEIDICDDCYKALTGK